MIRKLWDDMMERIRNMDKKSLVLMILLFLVVALFLGTLVRFVVENLGAAVSGGKWAFRPRLLIEPATWGLGLAIAIISAIIYAISGGFRNGAKLGRKMLGGKADSNIVESPLENSRFLTDQERDKYFPPFTYETLKDAKNDGVPVRAVLDRKGKLVGNFKPGVHALVIGATGSGKTTTFINPMIQILGATNCGSSMIMTDPKGELFDLHSGFLKSRGYNVMVLDLRDTYSSSRWNPLEALCDAYPD